MITINLDQGSSFLPGEVVSGKVFWQLPKPPEKAVLHLLWCTSGKGTEDISIIDEISFQTGGVSAEHPFKFTLPLSPYSFSGKILSLQWMLEMVLTKPDESQQQVITVSPTKNEINLDRDLEAASASDEEEDD